VDSKQLRELFGQVAHEDDPAFLTLRDVTLHARFPGIVFHLTNNLVEDFSDEIAVQNAFILLVHASYMAHHIALTDMPLMWDEHPIDHEALDLIEDVRDMLRWRGYDARLVDATSVLDEAHFWLTLAFKHMAVQKAIEARPTPLQRLGRFLARIGG
jgi:hypothetical protein